MGPMVWGRCDENLVRFRTEIDLIVISRLHVGTVIRINCLIHQLLLFNIHILDYWSEKSIKQYILHVLCKGIEGL